MSMAEINFITTTHLAQKVKEVINDIVASHSIKKVLDVPSGEGALSHFLAEELKLEVIASDIDAKKWKYNKMPLVEADMGRKLPFSNESFDFIICLEGIKHTTDVCTAMQEIARLLSRQGLLLITIPNDLAMEVRLRYFFDGFVDADWNNPMSHLSNESKSFLFANSILQLPQLNYFLEMNNLKIIRTETSRLRIKSLVLAILFYPLIYFSTTKACREKKWLRDLLCSFTWLAGRHNIVICKKN
jgi:ubiquinone/menaquinone biosynthesis C-methylase UbiE